jgi:hypothetical protein
MKTFVRKVLPLLILLAVVAVATYLKEFTGPDPLANKIETVSNVTPLVWNDRVATWDCENFCYGQEFEKGTRGHYDFWIANPSDAPTSVEVTAKSCQCSDVQLGIISRDKLTKALEKVPSLMTASNLPGKIGFDPSVLTMIEAIGGIDWLPMELKNVRQIPPADPVKGPQLAVMRMNWDAKNVGPLMMTADVNYYGRDRKAANVRFEVPIVVVNPATAYPQDVDVGDLRAGDHRDVIFTVWTASRPEVPLKLPDLPKNSCFVFGTPQPLTESERKQMQEKLHIEHPNQPPTKPQAGWKIPLTVYENYQGDQMDLGPFTRRLVFNQGTEFETGVTVRGVVRGDIRLASRETEDTIKLGDFQYNEPKNHIVYVTSVNPDVKLEIDSVQPPEMLATLNEESPGNWRLKITIPAEKITGQLSGAIVIRSLGPNPRKVRIPVVGSAYTP